MIHVPGLLGILVGFCFVYFLFRGMNYKFRSDHFLIAVYNFPIRKCFYSEIESVRQGHSWMAENWMCVLNPWSRRIVSVRRKAGLFGSILFRDLNISPPDAISFIRQLESKCDLS